MGTLRFILFYICALVIAAPPLNIKAPPPELASYSDSDLGLNLTQTAANDTLLNLFPSPPPTNISLNSIANPSAEADLPPDPFIVPTVDGCVIIFGTYRVSPWLSDLEGVILLAREDAIKHLIQTSREPMPPGLIYQHGHASLTLQVGPHLDWAMWLFALRQIHNFHTAEGGVSFNFAIDHEDELPPRGIGQVRTYG